MSKFFGESDADGIPEAVNVPRRGLVGEARSVTCEEEVGGAFYGPKIHLEVEDVLGRGWF